MYTYKILLTHLNIAFTQPLSTSKIASPLAHALLCTLNVAQQTKAAPSFPILVMIPQ